MRIALVKPDWRIAGGFERVLDRAVAALENTGHTVTRHAVDVPSLPRTPFGVKIPNVMFDAHAEYFRYMSMVAAFQALDVTHYDAVVSTQPPSFFIDHPRQLSLFYHHHKIYYDTSDAFVASGMVDGALHRHAEQAVRRVDNAGLEHARRMLTPSDTVRDRLRRYNGITDTLDPFLAGPTVEPPGTDDIMREPDNGVLCVSRHEFSKRAELFVHAMKYLPELPGVITGSGGRLPFVQSLDARLTRPGVDLDAVRDTDLWLNRGDFVSAGTPMSDASPDSNVSFTGHIADAELQRLFNQAICVVAPALSEDYGLTAIEAMAYARPIIVCNDGGGLVELVEDGITGYVVEPSGTAIAAAIRRIADDPQLAARLGTAARERALEYTWTRAFEQLRSSLARVMA